MSYDFFASIDVGSSKITMLIANIEDHKIHVFGHGTGVSKGVKNGTIIEPESAAKAIQKVIQQTRKTCNEAVKFVNINISDVRLETNNQNRQISFGGKSKIITKEDVKDAIQNACAGSIAANKKKLKEIVNHFTIDEHIVEYPIGLEAEVLGAQVHLNTVSNQALNGVIKCLEYCDLGIDEIILDSIAGSAACITQEEKDEGVCLLDMGAAVSNISVFVKGGVVFSQVFKLGGNNITDNIARAFNTSFEEAERLKLTYGVLSKVATLSDKLVKFKQIDSSTDYYLSLFQLIEIIEKSYQKICSLVKKSLKSEKLDRTLKAGFVVMGGASKIENCENFLLKEFRIRTKIAKINRDLISGNEELLIDSKYFSAFGLLMHNTSERYLQEAEEIQKSGVFGKMKKLFEL
jgi:cell division protein FtsA